MSFASGLVQPLVVGLATAVASRLFAPRQRGRSGGGTTTVNVPPLPAPKPQPKGPISISGTAARQKAGISSRRRRGGGISGLVLTGLGTTDSSNPTRPTLLGQ